MECNETVELTF